MKEFVILIQIVDHSSDLMNLCAGSKADRLLLFAVDGLVL